MATNRKHLTDGFILAERLLSNLPGVLSAKINTDSEGDIVEIHVLTDHNKMPKRIVRDVESALLSGFNIEIDHKKISVAQLRNPDSESLDRKDLDLTFIKPENLKEIVNRTNGHEESRLRFDQFDLVPSSNLKCRAEVVLANGRKVFKGSCEDTDTNVNQMKISSKAVLSALEEYLQGEQAFTLEELKVVKVNSTPVVIVVIGVVSQDEATSLVGTSFIRRDRNKAAAMATLKAVNRLISKS
jgi:hypothetical protein